jgi:ABC-type antimicrobial peptide transport system permease subunit
MLSNYIKLAWRNLQQQKLYSFINIAGLAIGLAVSIVLFLFVSNERHFDDVYSNKSHIYRVLLHTTGQNKQETWCGVPNAVAPTFRAGLPEVKEAARMLKHDFGATAFVKANNNYFTENRFYWCDASLFSIFNIPFISGTPAGFAQKPNSVVIAESVARKYFGTGNAIGQTLTVDNSTPLEITGVYKDLPSNSTLDCSIIANFAASYFARKDSWSNASFETYCLLDEHAGIAATEKKIQQLLNSHIEKNEQWYRLSLQPFEKVHLYSAGYSNTYTSRIGDIKEVKTLLLLAALVLVIACMNYMNLATARSQKKAKDVAINKTLGAGFRSLLTRFYIETGLLTLIALLLGVALSVAAIPLFNRIAGKDLHFGDLNHTDLLAGLGIIWLVTSLLAGSYPALYLSAFSPKQVMRQSFRGTGTAGIIRKSLVVLQFTASIVLISGVYIVYQQLQYIRNKNLGFKPENVVAITAATLQNEQEANTLINTFKSLGNVQAAGLAQGFPGNDLSRRGLKKDDADQEGIPLQTNRADAHIIQTLQLKLLAGKPLPAYKQPGDTLVEVILNKQAVDYLGYTPQEAIGKKINAQLGDNAYITGVVDNFNFASLHVPIGAYAFHNAPTEPKRYLLVRFSSSNLPQTLQQFETVFKKVQPASAFEYTFLDKQLENLYAAEQRTARIGLSFSLLAILVACLGLFGLAAYTAEQRTREIGIRKVLGASVYNISRLLSQDFIRLVLLAIVMAIPIAWYLAGKWLQDFAYRIHIGAATFLVTSLLAIAIALFTVSLQAIKAAVANPVKNLRTE